VWSTAERDAQVIADAVVAQHPAPTQQLVLGPEPVIRWNVAAYVDRSNIQSALELTYDREHVDVVLTLDPHEWETADVVAQVDIRPLSHLDDLDVLGG
jgi:hypothetical protein